VLHILLEINACGRRQWIIAHADQGHESGAGCPRTEWRLGFLSSWSETTRFASRRIRASG
jgi:hypothetical protein